MTDKLKKALADFTAMKYPSVEKLLRSRGYEYEADKVKALTDAYESEPPEPDLIGPCNFQIADVTAQAEYAEIELNDEETDRIWDEVYSFLKHCDSVSCGNDYISQTIENFAAKRDSTTL